jgi:hypothetical protein
MKHTGGARRAAGIALATALASLAIAMTPPARADVTCAATTAASEPSTPTPGTPGNPCWTEYPYPFGADGNPAGSDSTATPLVVSSLAFRAWNRGLAAVSGRLGGNSSPYSVWRFNGSSWYPDPTFPGPSVCSGNTILWAGKLDYWLIGGPYNPGTGQSGVCRFDGVNYQWDPFSIPAASLAHVPNADQSNFTLHSGACFSWDNCWFFGDYGVVDHWDGQTLSDASPGLGSSPWLEGGYTAAAAGVDAAGNPYGLAVTRATTADGGTALPLEPGSAAPQAAPQVFGSFGAAFSPLPSNPLVTSPGSSTLATDLVAVALDGRGGGWIGGDPVAFAPSTTDQGPPTGPAPLLPVSATGDAAACGGYPPTDFSSGPGSASWLWSSLSIDPTSGAALAGGQYWAESGGASEPGLVTTRCGQPPQVVLLGISPSNPGTPADPGGYVTAVAANASNDAWAATTAGNGGTPPQLYRLTDGQPPDAPAGNDDETRPLVFQIQPTIYVQSPGVIPPAAATVTTVTQQTTVTKRVKQKPAIYDVKAGKPVLGRGGRITLTISFKVRSPVTIGLEGLRGHKVVSSSGLRHFNRGIGRLALVLERAHWPTRLKFITPPAKHAADILSGPVKLTWTVRITA